MTLQNNMIFCTLFDSNYLDKGLALYKSMMKHIAEFKLYIFAFDDKCFNVLFDMQLKNVILLSLDDIMDDTLKRLQNERSRAEFCWTCTPVIIDYVLSKYQEVMCTYIDADIYFFASPVSTLQEIIDNKCSVGLVEHRFERDNEYGQNIYCVGKYCIQFNTFINNEEGIHILKEWKEDCFNWCYNIMADGKLGDQKYPDKWKLKYSGIHESNDLGAGVAPWNLHLYTYLGKKDGNIQMEFRGKKFQLVFYHFEGMKYLQDNKIFLNVWRPAASDTGEKIKLLYGEYFDNIASIRRYLYKSYDITFEHMIVKDDLWTGEYYSLKQFCIRNGVFEGFKCWWGYWKNNIITLNS